MAELLARCTHCTLSFYFLFRFFLILHVLHFHFSSRLFFCLSLVFESVIVPAVCGCILSKEPHCMLQSFEFPFIPSVLHTVCCCRNRTFTQDILNKCQLKAVMSSSVWHRIRVKNSSICVAFSVIAHKGVLLCPHSIFRMFSADRKRVETALENCNLPSGRVRHQNIKILKLPPFSVLLSLHISSISEAASVCVPLPCIFFLSQSPSSFIFSIQPSILQSVLSPFSSFFSLQKQRLIAVLLVCLESYFLDVCMTSHSELI